MNRKLGANKAFSLLKKQQQQNEKKTFDTIPTENLGVNEICRRNYCNFLPHGHTVFN